MKELISKFLNFIVAFGDILLGTIVVLFIVVSVMLSSNLFAAESLEQGPFPGVGVYQGFEINVMRDFMSDDDVLAVTAVGVICGKSATALTAIWENDDTGSLHEERHTLSEEAGDCMPMSDTIGYDSFNDALNRLTVIPYFDVDTGLKASFPSNVDTEGFTRVAWCVSNLEITTGFIPSGELLVEEALIVTVKTRHCREHVVD